jgi:hypothetical protein
MGCEEFIQLILQVYIADLLLEELRVAMGNMQEVRNRAWLRGGRNKGGGGDEEAHRAGYECTISFFFFNALSCSSIVYCLIVARMLRK